MQELRDDEIEQAAREYHREILGRLGFVTLSERLRYGYALEVVPTKAPKSQTENHRHIKKLRSVFGPLPLTSITPQEIYKFVDGRRKKKKDDEGNIVGGFTAARREVATLSHAFTKAVEWGDIGRHPFKKEVRLEGEKPRTRYIEDWEIVECLSLSPMRKRGSVGAIQGYIRLKLLTGLRRGDLLRLRVADCGADGIKITTNKTGKSIVYQWSEELKAAVEMAKAARPVDVSPYIFCTNRGKCYLNEATGEAQGWGSMWQRFMERVLTETKVTERFTEHDLRAKVGSDAESDERARQLLAHADVAMTKRAYRRKAEVVKPAR